MTSRTWTDVFDGVPIEDLTDRRDRVARLIQSTTYDRDEIERLVGDLWDPSLIWTAEDLRDLEMKARISQRRPCDEYAPSQTSLARWIRSFCFLSD